MKREPRKIRIGMLYSVCLDVNDQGDLQIRVYPIGSDALPWDSPFDTLDLLKADVDACAPASDENQLRAALQNLIAASDALASAIERATDQFDREKGALMDATSVAEKALKGGAP